MEVIIQRRAEVALRSLASDEQERVSVAIEKLRLPELTKTKIHVVKLPATSQSIFIYRATPRLRILLSREGETWSVDDIVDHDRLERTIMARSQQ